MDGASTTVRSATGFPMCIPRTDPAVSADAACPLTNRVLNANGVGWAGAFEMNAPPSVNLDPNK